MRNLSLNAAHLVNSQNKINVQTISKSLNPMRFGCLFSAACHCWRTTELDRRDCLPALYHWDLDTAELQSGSLWQGPSCTSPGSLQPPDLSCRSYGKNRRLSNTHSSN